ncbi:hypothetical protein ADUPG1_012758 [Aduncisulcus paluster]|uniref:DOC domain-containing protein n=1 Tax=Aduncisulcus paluster TaxID=2918883 RepID=A0ABQ5K2K5_9EUKA|nr:hypothetical protein ADUPG1_012758 [Aduncisulcus paluster]
MPFKTISDLKVSDLPTDFTVTSDTQSSSHGPESLIDGDVSSWWQSSGSKPHNVYFKFARARCIEGVYMNTKSGDGSYHPSNITLTVKKGGATVGSETFTLSSKVDGWGEMRFAKGLNGDELVFGITQNFSSGCDSKVHLLYPITKSAFTEFKRQEHQEYFQLDMISAMPNEYDNPATAAIKLKCPPSPLLPKPDVLLFTEESAFPIHSFILYARCKGEVLKDIMAPFDKMKGIIPAVCMAKYCPEPAMCPFKFAIDLTVLKHEVVKFIGYFLYTGKCRPFFMSINKIVMDNAENLEEAHRAVVSWIPPYREASKILGCGSLTDLTEGVMLRTQTASEDFNPELIRMGIESESHLVHSVVQAMIRRNAKAVLDRELHKELPRSFLESYIETLWREVHHDDGEAASEETHKTYVFKHTVYAPTLDSRHDEVVEGSIVAIEPIGSEPVHGWGEVKRGDVGKVTEVIEDEGIFLVEFQSGSIGQFTRADLELLAEPSEDFSVSDQEEYVLKTQHEEE